MKVLFAIGDAVTSENIVKQYYNLYGEKIEYKNVFYFKALLEEVKKDKTYNRIVIAEQLEPPQRNLVDAIDQMLFNNIDSITDEIEDAEIIFICSDGRTKNDSLIGRLFNIGIYNLLMGDERDIVPLCGLIKNPRNKKEAKEYLKSNPAVGGALAVSNDDDQVEEAEILNIAKFFSNLRTPEEYLKSFASVEEQYNEKQLQVITYSLKTNLKKNGEEIYRILYNDERFAKYCPVPPNAGGGFFKREETSTSTAKGGILGFLTGKKKAAGNANDNGPIEKLSDNNDIVTKTVALGGYAVDKVKDSIAEQAAAEAESMMDKSQQEAKALSEQLRRESEERRRRENELKAQQEAQLKAQQEAQLKAQQESQLKAQQEAQLKAQQEAQLKAQQEAQLKAQQEAQLKAQQEAQLKAQQEAQLKAQQEAQLKAQQEAQLKAQQEAQLKAQQEAQLKAQQEAQLKAQQEAQLKAQQEAQLKAQQEAQLKAQQEAQLKAQQEAQLRNQQEQLLKAQQEAQLRVQQEAKMKAEQEAKLREQQEAQMRAQQETRAKLQQEAKLRAEQEAKARAEQAEKLRAEQEAKLKAEQERIRAEQEALRAEKEALQKLQQQNQFEASNTYNTNNYGATNYSQNNYNASPEYSSNANVPQTQNYYESNQAPQVNVAPMVVPADYKKVVAFVGTHKVGTSFLVNSIATLMAMKGVKTSILDMTKNRGMYWFYNDATYKKSDVVATTMTNLSNGIATPIPVGKYKNLDLYTTIPGGKEDNRKGYRHRNIVETAKKNCNLLIIDCDFSTPYEYFEQASEVYIVQDLDLLKAQETIEFFRELKTRRMDWSKLRVAMNNCVKCKVTSKKIIKNALTYYNDPSMTFTEEFDEIKKYVEIPLDVQNYANYIESMQDGKLNYDKYTPELRNSLEQLSTMVYGLVAKKRGFFGS